MACRHPNWAYSHGERCVCDGASTAPGGGRRSADTWCPKCDGVLDKFSLHAGTCAAGGERTQRHNALRDLLASWADRAGLQAEVEKPGLLLPQRPDEARLLSDARQTSSCPPCPGALLHLTWPSRPHSGPLRRPGSKPFLPHPNMLL